MPHPAPAHKSFTDRNGPYQEITNKITAELEQGRVPWVQPWGKVGAPLGLPRNAATGCPYCMNCVASARTCRTTMSRVSPIR
jgi:antirestriction protein ArdC